MNRTSKIAAVLGLIMVFVLMLTVVAGAVGLVVWVWRHALS
jgi:hypothetical protein